MPAILLSVPGGQLHLYLVRLLSEYSAEIQRGARSRRRPLEGDGIPSASAARVSACRQRSSAQSFAGSFGTQEVDMNANASWRDVLEAYERDPAAPLVRQALDLA